jgi:hypothetical protein
MESAVNIHGSARYAWWKPGLCLKRKDISQHEKAMNQVIPGDEGIYARPHFIIMQGFLIKDLNTIHNFTKPIKIYNTHVSRNMLHVVTALIAAAPPTLFQHMRVPEAIIPGPENEAR